MAVQWIRNYRTYERNADADVVIRETKGKYRHIVSITFWRRVAKKIEARRFVRIGIDGNRVFFDLCDAKCDGAFKASHYSSTAFMVQVPVKNAPALTSFKGRYNVKNNNDNLLFIEKEN